MLTPANDVSALAALLQYASQHRSELKELGLRSLKYAQEMTHQEMHRQRVVLLKDMLDRHTGRTGM
jgi:hemerythrin